MVERERERERQFVCQLSVSKVSESVCVCEWQIARERRVMGVC